MTEQSQPLSVRAHAAAMLMYDGRGQRPALEDYAHLDGATTPTQPPAAADAPSSDPAPPSAPAGPGWDTAAFDALPPELRAAATAGAAQLTGRGFLEQEAASELIRPSDVHLYLTDPSKYVDPAGRVDRDAIRRDLYALTQERPELGRYGHGPGQVGARPEGRRQAAPDQLIGSQTVDSKGSLEGRVAAASAAMNAAW